MGGLVACDTAVGDYVVRWKVKEVFPGTIASLVYSSRQGTWHGQWDWVHHPYSYTPWLWMEERVPGDTQDELRLAVRVVWRDADTHGVRDQVRVRHAVSLAGDCSADEPPSPSPSPSPVPSCTSGYSPCLPFQGGADYDCYDGGGDGPYYTDPWSRLHSDGLRSIRARREQQRPWLRIACLVRHEEKELALFGTKVPCPHCGEKVREPKDSDDFLCSHCHEPGPWASEEQRAAWQAEEDGRRAMAAAQEQASALHHRLLLELIDGGDPAAIMPRVVDSATAAGLSASEQDAVRLEAFAAWATKAVADDLPLTR